MVYYKQQNKQQTNSNQRRIGMLKHKQYIEDGKTEVTKLELPELEKRLKEAGEEYSVVELHSDRYLVEKNIEE